MNKAKYESTRKEVVEFKEGAVWSAFFELDGLINISKLARQYFKKSQSWFSQKLHGCTVCQKEQSFSKEEYYQLAQSFRDIANRLNKYADEIDNAKE